MKFTKCMKIVMAIVLLYFKYVVTDLFLSLKEKHTIFKNIRE